MSSWEGREEKWEREEECRGGGGEREGRKDGRKGNKEVLHVHANL